MLTPVPLRQARFPVSAGSASVRVLHGTPQREGARGKGGEKTTGYAPLHEAHIVVAGEEGSCSLPAVPEPKPLDGQWTLTCP